MTTTPVIEGLERLASRLALLTSEDGEADNAGRAVGQLARRLGLSGGQLKAIFLAGVRVAGVPVPPADRLTASVEDPGAMERARGEAEELRGLLDRADHELHAATSRLAVLQDENEALRETLDRHRTTLRVLRVAAGVLVLAALAGGGFAWFGPGFRRLDPMPPADSVLRRMALAGASGADLFAEPDRDAPPIGRLAAGTRLPVRQLLWRGFSQWVETEVAGRIAYAPATEIDLR